jgi:hypothetical protein
MYVRYVAYRAKKSYSKLDFKLKMTGNSTKTQTCEN